MAYAEEGLTVLRRSFVSAESTCMLLALRFTAPRPPFSPRLSGPGEPGAPCRTVRRVGLVKDESPPPTTAVCIIDSLSENFMLTSPLRMM